MPYELIVLDNASTDGSAEAIAAAFPQARLIASRDNLGFAKGNNVAARGAAAEYILLLNPDTLVLDRAIDRLVAFAERTARRPASGAGRTLFADGSLNPTSAFGDLTLWSLFCRTTGLAHRPRRQRGLQPRGLRRLGPLDRARGRHRLGLLLPDPPRPLAAHGRLRPHLRDVRRGGRPLPPRARRRRPAPRMTPEATIVHYAGASSTRRSDKDILVLKAKATLIRRHLPAWQRPVGAVPAPDVAARRAGSAAASWPG